MKKVAPPSLIKWTGSKRSQAAEIASYFPESANCGTYYEPFVGSGAVLFYAATHFKKAIASDIYSPLIDLWLKIKQTPNVVIKQYAFDWKKLQENFPDYFYEVRERFNRDKTGIDLLFLSRTCVNGIIRFNSEGAFNNSIHLSRRGMLPDKFEKIVNQWTQVISKVNFEVQDYQAILSKVNENDFVYLDPPYANSHNRYINNLDIDRFLQFLYDLNSRKVKWALSFDGNRGDADLSYQLPNDLYSFKTLITSGNSAVQKVLNSSVESVQESLYLNYSPEKHNEKKTEQFLLF